MRVRFSKSSRSDLEQIGDYIAIGNPARAASFVDEVEEACARIGVAPYTGAMRPELGHGVRMVAYRRYLIFYRLLGEVVHIERVLHGARDIGSAAFDPEAEEIS